MLAVVKKSRRAQVPALDEKFSPELDDELPKMLHLLHLDSWRVMGFMGIVLAGLLAFVSAGVYIIGFDLPPGGLNGCLAPTVLGLRAKPVILYGLEEKHEPLGALY